MATAHFRDRKGDKGDKGDQGKPGLSAFDLWLQAGNKGSMSDFLMSLKGLPGRNGSKGSPGKDGEMKTVNVGRYGSPGQSAYEIAVNHGFVGTEEEWLASLQGSPGGGGGGSTDAVVSVYTTSSNIGTMTDFAIGDSATPISLTLPSANSRTNPITVKNAGSADLAVLTTGAQLIETESQLDLRTTNAVNLLPKNGKWYII